MKDTSLQLIVLDIDNTVFDWVTYYVNAMESLFAAVGDIIGCRPEVLASEARKVFTAHHSIEYPFLVQELASVNAHYGDDIDRMLSEAVEPGRLAFNRAAQKYLKPYPSVVDTLARIRADHPSLPIVALTDAPRYVAMWKLNKLGLLASFDAIYGLPDPVLPTSDRLRRVKVDPEILLKHLQKSSFGFSGKIRILPDEYEKPGTKGLKMVLIDYDAEERGIERRDVLWVGDNLRKDVGLGASLGVKTAWARYGTQFDPALRERLFAFSPVENVSKNVSLDPQDPTTPVPDHTLDDFSELITVVEHHG